MCISIGSAFSTYVIVPYRVEGAEKRIDAIETRERENREILTRIDERTQQILSRLQNLETKKP